ncbi:MAG: exosortase-associated EpsI family protein [Verrucomicrobiota bacterium]
MKRRNSILFVLVLAMIGATAGFIFYIKGNQRLGQPGVVLGSIPLFDEKTNRVSDVTVLLPDHIAGYESRAIPVSDIELEMLPKDTTFGKRRYLATNGANADVSVVLMGQDRTSLHKPQFCLTGQGWHIEKQEELFVNVFRPHPYKLPVIKIIASHEAKDRNGNSFMLSGIYTYWFVTDRKIGIGDQRMWSSMKHFLRTGTLERWAYISYFSRCLPGQEEATFQEVEKFIAASVPEFQIPPGKPLPPDQSKTRQTAAR